MTWYPACSGFEEGPGANFISPTVGNFVKQNSPDVRKLREARAGAIVAREARLFHERQARHYGVDTNRGIAHFRASKMYTREGNRLQEMFENGGDELGELPPKAVMKANRAAAKFHKQQADKAGLDSDVGHAHVAAMEHHMDILKKAKQQHTASKQPPRMEAKPGHGSKQSPVPVPNKSHQPSEDIHDPNKPAVQLHPDDANKPGAGGVKKLVQNETYGAHAGMIKASNRREAIERFGKPRRKRETGHSHRGLHDKLACTEPSPVKKQMKPETVFRGKRLPMHSGTKGVEAATPKGPFVKQRYDRSHPEGFEDHRYAGLKKGVGESLEGKRGWTARQRAMHSKMGKHIARQATESSRDFDDGTPRPIDLKTLYQAPKRVEGWTNSSVYSPPATRLREGLTRSGVVIKETGGSLPGF